MWGVNLWGVLVGAIASFAFGALWYCVLGKAWQAALGKSDADMKSGMATKFIVTFLCQIVMAIMLAGVLVHMGGATIKGGLISGALIWLGFVATTLIVNYIHQGAKRALTLIDGGHWLGVLLVQSVVIGALGPP